MTVHLSQESMTSMIIIMNITESLKHVWLRSQTAVEHSMSQATNDIFDPNSVYTKSSSTHAEARKLILNWCHTVMY